MRRARRHECTHARGAGGDGIGLAKLDRTFVHVDGPYRGLGSPQGQRNSDWAVATAEIEEVGCFGRRLWCIKQEVLCPGIYSTTGEDA